MRLIVALFFPFLIEVCWLLYCVGYSLCKITQLEKQDNRKCIFATDWILEQNSVRRTFKCVTTVTCLIMAAPHWCFYRVQWLFIHMIHIKSLNFWLERKDSWKKKFCPSQWWPILDLAHCWVWRMIDSRCYLSPEILERWEVWKHFCGLQNKLRKALLFITVEIN